MPFGDGTGPVWAESEKAGRGRGRARGIGCGRGFWRGFCWMIGPWADSGIESEDEREYLRNAIKTMESRLEAARKRLAEMEKEESKVEGK